MNTAEVREKIGTAVKLISEDSPSLSKIEKVLVLMRGVDARLDKKLDDVGRALSTLKNVQEGDVVSLTVENLPEETEKDKRKKKALILFIKSWKELRDEVERVRVELDSSKGQSTSQQVASFAKIAAFAKGPFGIITIAAIIIVGSFALVRGRTSQNQLPSVQSSPTVSTPTPTPSPADKASPVGKTTIKVITFSGKKIPLDQLEVKTGPDCTFSPREAPHYHAKNGQYVMATDGTRINDPGSCAFGKVDEVKVEEVSL